MSSSLPSPIPLSATKGSSQHPRLQQQMNVFTLPLDILSALSVRSLQVPAATITEEEEESKPSSSSRQPSLLPTLSENTEGGLACGVCPGSRFEDVDEQRSHFKEDWHRYNVRVKMALARIGDSSNKKGKGKVVSKEEFEGMMEDLSSISGSESSSSSTTSNKNTTSAPTDQVSNLLRKHKISSSSAQDPDSLDADDLDPSDPSTLSFLQSRAALRTAILWFTAPPSILPDTQLGIYRALFPSHLTNPADFLPRLRELQLTEQDLKAGEGEERRWIMLMVAGGHFAGMVIALGGKRTGKKMVKGEAGEVRVLKHKTFHRYTTRRKQGGSQSKHDSGNGAANSIGAQMRRAGEVMLQEEIRALLESWAEDFNIAERVFIRGSDSGKKIFWGYEDAVIEKTDERIRTFPFPTRRPTLSELLRCYQELTRVKTSFLTESALAELEATYIASLTPKPQGRSDPSTNQKPPSKSIASKAKLSEEEERDRERWRRLVEMIRKGKLDPLGAFWEKWSIGMGFGDGRGDGSLPGWLWEEEGKGKEGTLLMVAVVAGQEEVVRWLLEEKKMDPTVAVPTSTSKASTTTTSSGALIPSTKEEESKPEDEDASKKEEQGSGSTPPFRTAYDLSPNRSIRSVFRRTAHTHPELWDWTSLSPGGARVPSGLSAEMEEDQNAKKGERRKGLKEKMASRKKKEEVEELEVEPVVVVEKEKKAASAGRAGAQRLGGAVEGVGGTSGSLNGLSPEVRARIERERRARAAEARMAKGPGA